ncbi:uncharacterized protein K460DRAFT_399718 [Cucurbitaria berberidis CBS 394.84]|uniref:PHD-type domain-containing protein n=1 Tax=Cucurbitaria berberidis CBS 394.84 TaxID=1168544 RepID=A0A9P4GQL9_9PLEO|nr:uncharacterized protein K460DRAFT_399718 [Cucurbitaria berberidis CBS 394.84]KAF1849601.1 hypothetical protein K460DRAFT_399718 [Cucurbitaria berberidis CBS 394.84]
MKDVEARPRAPFGDNPETSMGAHDKASHYSNLRERLSARISPPPLKRQRTGLSTSIPTRARPSSTALPTRPLPGLREVKRSSGSSTPYARPVHEKNKGGRVSESSRNSFSFVAPHLDRDAESLNRSAKSRNSDEARSSLPSRKTPSSKPTCRVCEKHSATNYNPIITCPGCGRAYHDSCRNPPLIDGIEQSHWRCLKCLSDNLSRGSSGFAKLQAPKAVSVLPSARNSGCREDKKRRPDKVLLVDDVLNSPVINSSKSGKDSQAIQQPNAPPILERTEVPNTPTQRSSQFDIPESAPKQRFADNSVASSDIGLPLTGPLLFEKTTPLTVLCSICRKQRILAENSRDGGNCRNCRNRSLIVEAGKLEIPETPNATPADEETAQSSPQAILVATTSTPASETKQASMISSQSAPVSSNHFKMIKSGISVTEWMQSESIALKLTRPRSSSGSRPPTDTGSESPAVPLSEKHYNICEMAQIALVAADGAHLTTSQIIDWIASTFPYLREIEVGWERSLASKLAREQEFCSHKIVGQGKKRFWTFADDKVKAQCEKKHAAFRPRPNANSKISRNSSATTESLEAANQPFRGDKRILSPLLKPTQPTPVQTDAAPDLLISTSKAPFIPNALIPSTKLNDSLCMPFERSMPHQPQSVSNSGHNIKRETSFYTVFPQYRKRSDVTMKSADRMEKIAEIKRRPSRKEFFGSDHRLAHVRRFRRQDIHDESDGAWMSSRFDESEGESKPGKGVEEKDSKRNRSLREVFDLPANAIPMNDGQTELAFRDGTRINGRLPRPRQIYRVGKLFGGVLTVRAS